MTLPIQLPQEDIQIIPVPPELIETVQKIIDLNTKIIDQNNNILKIFQYPQIFIHSTQNSEKEKK